MIKKIFTLIISLVMILSITACGDDENSGNLLTETPTEQDRTESETVQDIIEPETEHDDYSGTISETPTNLYSGRSTIAISNTHIIGVKTDGTVVARSTRIDFSISNIELSDWCDVVAVAAGQYISYGLKSDGTVLAVGHVMDINRGVSVYQDVPDLSHWNNLVDILAYGEYLYGLRNDGTMLTNNTNIDISNWSDITDFDVSSSFVVGLRSDGSIVTSSHYCSSSDLYLNDMLETVSNWSDILDVAIVSSLGFLPDHYAFGLRSDGALEFTSAFYTGQAIVNDGEIILRQEDQIMHVNNILVNDVFSNIISIKANINILVGLHADGTLTIFKITNTELVDPQSISTNWNDIVSVAFYSERIIGLKSDGTVMDTDTSSDSINDWYDIMIP